MKSFVRNALLGAAGLIALSLPVHAAGATAVADTPLFKSPAATTKPMQMTQYYGTSSGSVGFKKSKKKKAKKKK